MKKKYVVYYVNSYLDDCGFLHFNKRKVGGFNSEEDAIIHA